MRTVKYGETSLVVTAFTELFGVQSYMVNGVRSSKRSAGISIGHLQAGNLLDMTVYQHDRGTLQRIKDCKLLFHGQNLTNSITKNGVMLFVVELLQKCLKQPDPHPELFYFIEDVLQALDEASATQTANLPLFFMLHLSHFFGFRLMDNYSESCTMLDLHEGQFVTDMPVHGMYLEKNNSKLVSDLLKVMQVSELEQFELNRQVRNEIIDMLAGFYAFHVQPFGSIKSLPVLRSLWKTDYASRFGFKSLSSNTTPGFFPFSKLPSISALFNASAPFKVAHCKMVSMGTVGKLLRMVLISAAMLNWWLLL